MTPPIPILYRYQHDIGRDIYYVLVERSHRALFSSDHRPKSQDDPLHTVTHDRSVVNYSRISHNDITRFFSKSQSCSSLHCDTRTAGTPSSTHLYVALVSRRLCEQNVLNIVVVEFA